MSYYLNMYTKESQWDQPTEPAKKAGGGSAGGGDAPDEVHCLHLLVKHKGSRRPSSWREANITRTKEEAQLLLEVYRNKIVQQEATFDELARSYSDCSSAKRGGDLGKFGRGMYISPLCICHTSRIEWSSMCVRLGIRRFPLEAQSRNRLVLPLEALIVFNIQEKRREDISTTNRL